MKSSLLGQSLFLGICIFSLADCSSPDEDALCQKALSSTSAKAEAVSWLQTKDGKERTFGVKNAELNAAAALSLVQDFYRDGAVVVTVVDIKKSANKESTQTIIVTLPKESDKRGKIFELEGHIAEEQSRDATMDTGQKYLMLY